MRRAPYLNFDAQLLQPPANGYIEGIVGEGYERLVKGEKEEDDGEFHALSSDYEMASYFKAMEPLAFAGGLGSRIARIDDNTPARRLLIERHSASKLQFPMHAGAKHGVRRYAKVSFKEHSQTITAMPSQSQLQHRCGTNPYLGFENTCSSEGPNADDSDLSSADCCSMAITLGRTCWTPSVIGQASPTAWQAFPLCVC